MIAIPLARFYPNNFSGGKSTHFTRRLWLAFTLIATPTLLSTVIDWISLRVISRVEQTNTQELIPMMNMAKQLSESSVYELFSKYDQCRQLSLWQYTS